MFWWFLNFSTVFKIRFSIWYPAGIYLLKFNNRNTRKKVWNMFKVSNKDTRTTPMVIGLLLGFGTQWIVYSNLSKVWLHTGQKTGFSWFLKCHNFVIVLTTWTEPRTLTHQIWYISGLSSRGRITYENCICCLSIKSSTQLFCSDCSERLSYIF